MYIIEIFEELKQYYYFPFVLFLVLYLDYNKGKFLSGWTEKVNKKLK